jgi:hypothetical protein
MKTLSATLEAAQKKTDRTPLARYGAARTRDTLYHENPISNA